MFCENHLFLPPFPSSHRGDSDGEKYLITISRGLGEGEGEALGFLIRRSDQLEQRGVGHAASGGREYFKPADSLQSQISSGDPSSAQPSQLLNSFFE